MAVCPHCKEPINALYIDEVDLKSDGGGGPKGAYVFSCYNLQGCGKVISVSLRNEKSLLKGIEEIVKDVVEEALNKS